MTSGGAVMMRLCVYLCIGLVVLSAIACVDAQSEKKSRKRSKKRLARQEEEGTGTGAAPEGAAGGNGGNGGNGDNGGNGGNGGPPLVPALPGTPALGIPAKLLFNVGTQDVGTFLILQAESPQRGLRLAGLARNPDALRLSLDGQGGVGADPELASQLLEEGSGRRSSSGKSRRKSSSRSGRSKSLPKRRSSRHEPGSEGTATADAEPAGR